MSSWQERLCFLITRTHNSLYAFLRHLTAMSGQADLYLGSRRDGAFMGIPEDLFLAHIGTRGEAQPLRDHLLAVSTITSRLATKTGMPRAGALIGLVHDLGKYSDAFQQYLRRVAGNASLEMEPDLSLRGSVDHSTAGAQTIARGLAHYDAAAEALALCVASHHSGLIDCIQPNGNDGLTRRLNKDNVLSHHNEAWDRIEPAVRGPLEELLNDPEVTAEIAASDGSHSRIRQR